MRRPVPRLAVLLLLGIMLGSSDRAPGASGRPAPGPDDLFSGRTIPQIHLTLADDAIATLATDPREYVRGAVWVDGVRWTSVGVRIKGHRSIQSWDGKPAFKLHFGKFDDDARFYGLEKLALNNMVEDPTMVREALAYALHRAAGVPAPRTAYAQVYVNRRPYGLYLMVEPTDDEAFLDAHAEDGSGSLYECAYGCDLYADDDEGFEQDAGDDESRDDLASLAAAAAGPADQLFAAGGPIDLPRVLAYLAVSAFVGDFDGYRHGHNYRIYHDPARDTWTFLPWGLDRTFRKHLGLYDSGGLVAKRCFADATCRRQYVETMVKIVGLVESLDLRGEIERTASFISDAVRRDPRRPYSIKEVGRQRDTLRDYLDRRVREVRAQLGCIDGGVELDRDGDGFGCLDVDDADPLAHPGAVEACDGLDNDGNGLTDDGAACACPEVLVDGAAFALCDLPMTWSEAAEFCVAQGATLARIDSKAESRALDRAAQAMRKTKSKWWIGATDRADEDVFLGTDGAPLAFTRWRNGEPDNDSCNQDCAALGGVGNGKWTDTHCASRLPFVCRR